MTIKRIALAVLLICSLVYTTGCGTQTDNKGPANPTKPTTPDGKDAPAKPATEK